MANSVVFGRRVSPLAGQPLADLDCQPLRRAPISGCGTSRRQLRSNSTIRWHPSRDPPAFARCRALPTRGDTQARSSVDPSLDGSENSRWHEEAELDTRDGGSQAGICDEPYVGTDYGSFPLEWRDALEGGRVPLQVAEAYLRVRAGVWGPLCMLPGFRDRLVADSSFMVKVGIEVGIGICTKTAAEATKRGPDFVSQLDFVLANILMALLADLALVYLPAPTIAYGSETTGATQAAEANAVQRFLQSCPENRQWCFLDSDMALHPLATADHNVWILRDQDESCAFWLVTLNGTVSPALCALFQKVPPGYAPFTLAQRGGALLRNGSKLLVVGTAASLVGVSITDGIVAARQLVDPTWVHLSAPQDILPTSMAYGAYMAVSSNIRYQIIAGVIEQRGIEELFKNNKQLCNVLSLVVRTANTFLGSLLWVDFLRWLGLQ